MWFETDVLSAARRRFPDWFGFRQKAQGSSDSEGSTRRSSWPGIRPIRETETSKSDGSDGKHLDPEGHADSTWRMGWTDGRSALTSDAYLRLVQAEGAIADLERMDAARFAAETANARLSVATVTVEQIRRDLDDCEAELAERARDRRRNLGSYSVVLGFFYLIVGSLLLFADVPLSLLVSRALGLVADDVSLDDLRAVLADPLAYWEPLAVAIGLALLGVVFKMAADFFFHRTADQSTPWTKATARAFFIVLLILVTATIIAVGVIRGTTHRIDNGGLPQRTFQVLMERVASLGTVVFTLMALSFSVAGAVCFSSGASRTINAIRIRALEREVRRVRASHVRAVEVMAAERANADVQKQRLVTTQQSAGLDVELKSALYLHGYARGLTVPETVLEGSSIYERAKRYRDRLIATAVQRENINREQWRRGVETLESTEEAEAVKRAKNA